MLMQHRRFLFRRARLYYLLLTYYRRYLYFGRYCLICLECIYFLRYVLYWFNMHIAFRAD